MPLHEVYLISHGSTDHGLACRFNVYVAQPEVKPGCVLRRSNVRVLESRKLVSSEEVSHGFYDCCQCMLAATARVVAMLCAVHKPPRV